MALSKRLTAVADLIDPGTTLVDIGTDHGFLPIYLIRQGVVPHAIATDVREGPLNRAREHIEEAGLTEKIELRLSDGFDKIHPGEGETAVLSGMGGPLMIRLLSDQKETSCSFRFWILEPQSEVEKVRSFLVSQGCAFLQEDMVKDEGKYYPLIKVSPPSATEDQPEGTKDWDEVQLRYGRLLLETRHPVLYQYLQKERQIKEQLLSDLQDQNGQRSVDRQKEILKELSLIQEAFQYYD